MAMDAVRVHYNSPKPAELQALAYTRGTDIYLGPGQDEHLPHEAWHVVQQAQGRVQPTTQMKGEVAGNDDLGLEHEADVMGSRALQVQDGGCPPCRGIRHVYGSAVTQRRLMKDRLNTPEVWKVGDQHVKDILEATRSPERPYNLVTREDFEQEFGQWQFDRLLDSSTDWQAKLVAAKHWLSGIES
jgi:hypothetical protein